MASAPPITSAPSRSAARSTSTSAPTSTASAPRSTTWSPAGPLRRRDRHRRDRARRHRGAALPAVHHRGLPRAALAHARPRGRRPPAPRRLEATRNCNEVQDKKKTYCSACSSRHRCRRTRSSANGANLLVSAGTLSPAFAPGTFAYTDTVANSVTDLTVTPSDADTNALIEVQVNGGGFATVASGAPSALLPLNVGNNAVDVRITGEFGSPQLTYTVTVTRLAVLTAGTLSYNVPQGYPLTIPHADIIGASTFSRRLLADGAECGPDQRQWRHDRVLGRSFGHLQCAGPGLHRR